MVCDWISVNNGKTSIKLAIAIEPKSETIAYVLFGYFIPLYSYTYGTIGSWVLGTEITAVGMCM